MRKRAFQVGSALLLAVLLVAPTLAGTFKSDMICSSNGNLIVGDPGDAKGTVAISDDGNLKFEISGLTPFQECACLLECAGPGFFEDLCTADSKGRLNVTFKGVASPAALGGGCLNPTPFVGCTGAFCATGYGTVPAP